MFSKLALVASLTVLAVATAVPNGESGGSSSCSTGPVQCCDSVQNASSPDVVKECDLLGIDAGSLIGPVGLSCTPVTILGINGGSCSTQTVCCENNNFNGAIAIGCTPINIDL